MAESRGYTPPEARDVDVVAAPKKLGWRERIFGSKKGAEAATEFREKNGKVTGAELKQLLQQRTAAGKKIRAIEIDLKGFATDEELNDDLAPYEKQKREINDHPAVKAFNQVERTIQEFSSEIQDQSDYEDNPKFRKLSAAEQQEYRDFLRKNEQKLALFRAKREKLLKEGYDPAEDKPDEETFGPVSASRADLAMFAQNERGKFAQGIQSVLNTEKGAEQPDLKRFEEKFPKSFLEIISELDLKNPKAALGKSVKIGGSEYQVVLREGADPEDIDSYEIAFVTLAGKQIRESIDEFVSVRAVSAEENRVKENIRGTLERVNSGTGNANPVIPQSMANSIIASLPTSAGAAQ